MHGGAFWPLLMPTRAIHYYGLDLGSTEAPPGDNSIIIFRDMSLSGTHSF